MGGNPNPKGGGHAKITDLTTAPDRWMATVEGMGDCPFRNGDYVVVALDPTVDNGDSGADGDSQK